MTIKSEALNIGNRTTHNRLRWLLIEPDQLGIILTNIDSDAQNRSNPGFGETDDGIKKIREYEGEMDRVKRVNIS